MKAHLPAAILARQDKMGFPVPLNDWMKHEVRDFVVEVFSSQKALSRDLIDNAQVLRNLDLDRKFGRKLWGLLSLELWQQEFHDQAHRYKSLLNEEVTV
jgi:asparagine synthase (glutamine-hydrolysing)